MHCPRGFYEGLVFHAFLYLPSSRYGYVLRSCKSVYGAKIGTRFLNRCTMETSSLHLLQGNEIVVIYLNHKNASRGILIIVESIKYAEAYSEPCQAFKMLTADSIHFTSCKFSKTF